MNSFLNIPISVINKFILKKLTVLIKFASLVCLLSLTYILKSQNIQDSTKIKKWSFHFQSTVIGQYHPPFYAKYSGLNSLNPGTESPVSITTTIFLGTKLWKGAEAYFNPELSGGGGFSMTTGVAGFPNGEVYRVSDPSPHVYIARLFLKQTFPLSDEYEYISDDVNQVATRMPTSFLSLYGGKFSVMDYFDNNQYSHDARTQFYNWALMGNGAWDYPANTRGYNYGVVAELIKPNWALRYAVVLVPTVANGSMMDAYLLHANSEALEFEHKYRLGNKSGTIRLMTYLNQARMGNYRDAIKWGILHHTTPKTDSVRSPGHTKYGFGINIEQSLSKYIGAFMRVGWNDGNNETWAFTEIDNHLSAGFVLDGNRWRRKNDRLGIAQIVDGISKDHRDYLRAGGYGFIIGDGNLNYGLEYITEIYYSFYLKAFKLSLSPDYQFIIHPAYNKDRGPVHAFGLRAHFEI